VLAPTVWTLSAVAFTQDLTGRARDEQTIEALTGFLLLLLAGAAYAILLLPRFSPVGPLTTGVLFLTVCVWVLIDPGSFDGLFPAAVRKPGFDLTLPAHGLGALLAVPLLCTALSRRRWRTARFDPADATTSTFIWPFARPTRPGTLVVPGVTGVPTSDATQVLILGEPAGPTQVLAQDRSAPGDRTQVIPGTTPAATGAAADAATDRPAPPPADATQALPPTADATQTLPPTGDATQKLPPAAPAGDATQTLPPTGDATQTLPPTGDATQKLPPTGDATQKLPPTAPAADATQTLPPTADATQTLPPTADATQTLPPTGDATQKLPSAGDATQVLPPPGDATRTLPPAAEPDAAVSGGTPTAAGPGGPLPAEPVETAEIAEDAKPVEAPAAVEPDDTERKKTVEGDTTGDETVEAVTTVEPGDGQPPALPAAAPFRGAEQSDAQPPTRAAAAPSQDGQESR
jgi:hypothetical protein